MMENLPESRRAGRPLILVSPCTEQKGTEFADLSISLSNRYGEALFRAGGLPVVMPATTSRDAIAEFVRITDGVLLTGGDDVQPCLYGENPPKELEDTIKLMEPERDAWEMILVEEVFKQQKPLFGICRGQQILNVALGGSLIIDIPTQVAGALNHRQMERKMEPVHEVTLTPGSLVAKICIEQTLMVNSTHHQAVGRVADRLRVTARSPIDGVIEAVELKEPSRLPFLLAVQFHPERLIDLRPVFLDFFVTFVAACASNRKNL